MSLSPEYLEAILNGPALLAPPGVTTNFNSKDSNAVYVLPVAVTVASITTILLILRIYTKRVLTRSMAWEDYTSILAWAMLIGFLVPGCYTIRVGGKHQWDTRVKDMFEFLHYANIVEIIYSPTMFVVKLSILLQYMRIFVPRRDANRAMFIMIHIVLWSSFVLYTTLLFLKIFSCNPREKAWNKLIKGTCINIEALIVAGGSVNVVSDFVVLFLPMYSIWKLQMSFRKKVQVSAVFAFGLLACVASIMRLVYSVLLFRTKDQSRILIPVGLWSTAEISTGFICSCLPVLPKFFQVMGPKLLSSHKSSTGGSTPLYFKTSSKTKTSAGDNGGDVYDSRRNLAGGYRGLTSLEMISGTGGRDVEIKGGRRPSEPDEEEGRIMRTVRVDLNEMRRPY